MDFPTERQTVYFLLVRACFSGREFHVGFPLLTQQAFLEGPALAFSYFGGVFRVLRFDNLSAAVKKVLRGRRREDKEYVLMVSGSKNFLPKHFIKIIISPVVFLDQNIAVIF